MTTLALVKERLSLCEKLMRLNKPIDIPMAFGALPDQVPMRIDGACQARRYS